MKALTKRVHNIVSQLGLDGLLAHQSKNLSFLRNFVPTNKEYTSKNRITVKRDHAQFELQLNDYMQWHVFANIPEPLWEVAWNSLTDRSIIFDIGANIGAFTLKAAGNLTSRIHDYTIYAFEPNHEVSGKLRLNVKLNPNLEPNIQIETYALSDKNGEMYFEYSLDNSGAGKLTDKPSGSKVDMITLDHYFQKKDLDKVDLIKIDVEGFEPLVLKGAKYVIEKYKPTLIIEITDEWFKKVGSSADEILMYLEQLGYIIYCDIENKVKPFTAYNHKELPFQYNVLAIHESRN